MGFSRPGAVGPRETLGLSTPPFDPISYPLIDYRLYMVLYFLRIYLLRQGIIVVSLEVYVETSIILSNFISHSMYVSDISRNIFLDTFIKKEMTGYVGNFHLFLYGSINGTSITYCHRLDMIN